MATVKTTRNIAQPLRLLALDGGGVRGLSTLLILSRLMYLYNEGTNPPKKPCEVFHVIAGTSTGGLIAIMLGRLEMDVDTAIGTYIRLSKTIFTPRMISWAFGWFRASRILHIFGYNTFDHLVFEKAIKEVVENALKGREQPEPLENAPLLQDNPKCKIFVCASMANGTTQRLRNYDTRSEEPINCTIWEAARATSAAPTFFDHVKFSNGMTFRDGAFRDNNPISELILEVEAISPGRNIASVVSIGTGVPPTISVGSGLLSVATACAKIATDTEEASKDFINTRCSGGGGFKDKYFRFNVAHGLQNVGLEEWQKLDDIQAHTRTYLQLPQQQEALHACVRSLQDKPYDLKIERGSYIRSDAPLPLDLDQNEALVREHKKFEAAWFNSLDFEQNGNRYSNIKTPHSKTCEWFLTNERYKRWSDDAQLSNYGEFLWLKGNPGTGKSTVMKFTISEANRSRKEDVRIHYFFYAGGSELERGILGMYRSLLFQLFTQLPTVMEVFASFDLLALPRSPKWEWKLHQLESVFRRAIQKHLNGRRLWIFIDALDECDEDQARTMVTFFKSLEEDAFNERAAKESTVKSRAHLRVLFASRHYPRITIPDQVEIVLEKEKEHLHDIKHYIDTKLRPADDPPSEMTRRLREDIERRASGVFIWVVLVVRILNQAWDHGITGREKLEEIPDGMSRLLEGIMTRDTQNLGSLRPCIQWVLFAKRPLSREELYCALISATNRTEDIPIQQMDAFILSCSKGLVELTERNGTAQFIHESIREFFLNQSGAQYIQEASAQPITGFGHNMLTQSCYDIIISTAQHGLIPNLGNLNTQKRNNDSQIDSDFAHFSSRVDPGISHLWLPFVEYALLHVLYHANLAEHHRVPQEDFLRNFRVQDYLYLLHFVFRGGVGYIDSYSLLFILTSRNLSSLVKTMLRIYPDIDIVGDSWGKSPILMALENRYDDILGDLLTPKDVGTISDYSDYVVRRPTSSEIESLIVSYASCDISEIRASSLIQNFFQNGKESDILTLARSGRFQLNTAATADFIPLGAASERGFEDLVSFLLNRLEVSPNYQDSRGLTPLSRAAKEGRYNIVRLLLRSARKVDVNLPCDNGRSSLSYAAEKGNCDIVDLLLEEDVNINLPDKNGRMPLYYAAKSGAESVVESLIHEPGIDIGTRDRFGQTVLFCAVLHEREGVVIQLLKTGLTNVPDHRHITPLLQALRSGHNYIARLLLEQLDVEFRKNERDNSVSAPLFQAFRFLGHHIAKPLLGQFNVEPRKPEDESLESNDATGGQTPLLLLASAKGCASLLDSMVNTTEAEVDPGGNMDGRARLFFFAAQHGYNILVTLLLENNDADADPIDIRDGRTPLSWAAANGHVAVVEELLSVNSVDPNSKDTGHGRTPLWWAAGQGHAAVVKLLLLKDTVEPDLTDSEDDRTPLTVAAKNGHKAVVELLLADRRVVREAEDRIGRTPWLWAHSNGYPSIGQMLECN